jgi:hypothetical protein
MSHRSVALTWRSVGLLVLVGLVPRSGSTAEAIDLRHVPANAVAAVVVHPQRLAQSPELELLPWEVIQTAVQQEMGLNPLAIEQAIGLAAAPSRDAPPDWGVVLQFSQPQQLAAKLLEQTEAATAGQVAYRRALEPLAPSFCQFDGRTLLVGSEAMVIAMITAGDATSPLRELLAKTPARNDVTAVLAFSQIREFVQGMLADVPPLPPPLQPFLEVPDKLETVMVAVNLSQERPSGIKLIATNEAAAQELETTLRQALGFAKQMLLGQAMQTVGDGDDAVQQAMQRYLMRVANTIEGRLQPARSGNQVVITLKADYAGTGIMVALLLPAIQAAREAARRTESFNNLKNLALAMHNYHDTFKGFPAAYNVDAQGKPLLSWRVHVLPFVEQRALYEQFHLDEPWDSPHNRPLIARMPNVFRAPGSKAPPGKTNYLGVRGEDTIFTAPKDGAKRPVGCLIQEITDGTSNTIMIVEAGDEAAVEWTRPADYELDPEQPLKGLVKLRPGGFLGALADGSVQFVPATIDAEMLRRLFAKSDGRPVQID